MTAKRPTSMNPRRTALHLLGRIETEGTFLNRVLSSPEITRLELRDRQFVRELLIGTVRRKLRLDRCIDAYYNKDISSLDPLVFNVLRLGMYQLLLMDSVPAFAAVNESVKIATELRNPGAGGLVNAVLRKCSTQGEPAFPREPVERLSVAYSHPRWIVERWMMRFGEKATEKVARAGDERHPIFIRVNMLKTTVDELADILAGENIEILPVEGFELYLSVGKASGLFDIPAFRDGMFTVQDPAAGCAVDLLNPEPGERVIDLCSAPGGKTTHIAELMGDSGTITAVDSNAQRLGLVAEAVERLGIGSVTCVAGDASVFSDKAGYDRVLLDAPCTGTGVFSKRPDMKWRLRSDDIPRLASYQCDLLSPAAKLVKPGGVLVYSTCTLEPEENEDNVDRFLDGHRNFSLESDDRFSHFSKRRGYLILPHEAGGTGAFAVRFRRS